MAIRAGVVVLLAALLCAGCNKFDVKSNDLKCLGFYKDSTAETKIEACTALINDETRDQEDHALNFHWRGVANIEAHHCENALADFEASLALKPKHAIAVVTLDRGRAKSCLGRYEDAILDFDKARSLDPKTFAATALIQRGYADLSLHRLADAMKDSDEAIALKPNLPNGYRNRGIANLELGNYLDAVADFDRALKIGADDGEILSYRGIAHLRLHQYEAAIRDYDAVLAKKPGNSAALSNRGLANRGLGRIDQAERDYGLAVAGNAENGNALSAHCFIRATWNRDLATGLAECDAAERLNPAIEQFRLARVFVLYRMNRYPEAIAECDRALKHEARNPLALFLRGLAKDKMHLAGADQDVEAALALYPAFPDFFADVGVQR